MNERHPPISSPALSLVEALLQSFDLRQHQPHFELLRSCHGDIDTDFNLILLQLIVKIQIDLLERPKLIPTSYNQLS